MARTVSGAERTLLGGGAFNLHAVVEVQNDSGTWIDITSWLRPGLAIDETIDARLMNATIPLVAHNPSTGDSLHPLNAASPWNVDDAAAYAPLLASRRGVRIWEAVTAAGAAVPAFPGAAWHAVFEGYLDEPEATEDGEFITCPARDLGSLLADRIIEVERIYGSAAGTAVETVMQQILDDTVGVGAVTIVLPSGSPGWMIREYTQARVSSLDAVAALADQIGWDLRYRWPATGNVTELHFYPPDRAKTVPDFTLPPGEYLSVTSVKIGDRNVRNVIRVYFSNRLAGGARDFREAIDAASVGAFGRQYFEITEAGNIDTPVEAQAMADAILSDLSVPMVDHHVTSLHLWFAQLGDLVAFPQNTVHYDSDQAFAVVGIRRTWESEGHATIALATRGKPAGQYAAWILKHGTGTPTTDNLPAPRFTYLLGEASHGGGVSGDGMVWMGVEFEPNTEYVGVWGEEGDDANTPTPDIANNSQAVTLHRQEGVDSSALDWKTAIGIATRPNRWRRIRACGFGPTGIKGMEWIPPAVQAVDPSPTPADGTIASFTVTPLLDTNVLQVTAANISGGGYWLFFRRDGVDLFQLWIDDDVGPWTWNDTFINPNAAYTYEVFCWNNGVSGPHARWVAGLATPPAVTWLDQTPRLVQSAGFDMVYLNWQLTGLGTADHTVIEVASGGGWGILPFTDLTTVPAAQTTLFHNILGAKWYRLRVEDAGNVALAYSTPAYFSGVATTGSQGVIAPVWNPEPRAIFIRTIPGTIGIPAVEMGFICATSGAATCGIQKSPDDGVTPWVDVYISRQLAGDVWQGGAVAEQTFYRLIARDFAGFTLAVSSSKFWNGIISS